MWWALLQEFEHLLEGIHIEFDDKDDGADAGDKGWERCSKCDEIPLIKNKLKGNLTEIDIYSLNYSVFRTFENFLKQAWTKEQWQMWLKIPVINFICSWEEGGLMFCVCNVCEKLSGRVQLEGHLPRWGACWNFSFQPWILATSLHNNI